VIKIGINASIYAANPLFEDQKSIQHQKCDHLDNVITLGSVIYNLDIGLM
jgi:hypothetical protein